MITNYACSRDIAILNAGQNYDNISPKICINHNMFKKIFIPSSVNSPMELSYIEEIVENVFLKIRQTLGLYLKDIKVIMKEKKMYVSFCFNEKNIQIELGNKDKIDEHYVFDMLVEELFFPFPLNVPNRTLTFFNRCPNAFRRFADKLIPDLISKKIKKNGRSLRIWVCGCSSTSSN